MVGQKSISYFHIFNLYSYAYFFFNAQSTYINFSRYLFIFPTKKERVGLVLGLPDMALLLLFGAYAGSDV